MSTTKLLSQLFRSIASRDFESAMEISEQICGHEEARGHINVAKALRGALHASGSGISNNNGSKALQQPLWFDAHHEGMDRLFDKTSLDSVFLRQSTKKDIHSVINEYKLADALKQKNISPRSKLIFHGYPGCGKSLSAKAIATELELPLYMLRFDEIIGAYLGQTATKLRSVFRFVEESPCVLLLDEVDAIGRRRGDTRDVGELDRIVISLMQELEHSSPKGLIIATTNIPDELDQALWRRFDLAVEFVKPTKTQIKNFAIEFSKTYNFQVSKSVLQKFGRVDSYAECEKLLIDEMRDEIISDSINSHGKEKESNSKELLS